MCCCVLFLYSLKVNRGCTTELTHQGYQFLSSLFDKHDEVHLLTPQGVPEKIAQSLKHHNFATVHYRVMPFSAKCSERKYLHDKGQYRNTTIF